VSGAGRDRAGIVDERALDRLAAELHGSRVIVSRFVDDFVGSWDGRMTRLHAACAAADATDAYVTLLSIRTTSEMVGAVALADLAGRLQAYASTGRLDVCCRSESALAEVGARTMAALGGRR
jgi:hypothetical protein